jgi:hypothetical protein
LKRDCSWNQLAAVYWKYLGVLLRFEYGRGSYRLRIFSRILFSPFNLCFEFFPPPFRICSAGRAYFVAFYVYRPKIRRMFMFCWTLDVTRNATGRLPESHPLPHQIALFFFRVCFIENVIKAVYLFVLRNVPIKLIW